MNSNPDFFASNAHSPDSARGDANLGPLILSSATFSPSRSNSNGGHDILPFSSDEGTPGMIAATPHNPTGIISAAIASKNEELMRFFYNSQIVGRVKKLVKPKLSEFRTLSRKHQILAKNLKSLEIFSEHGTIPDKMKFTLLIPEEKSALRRWERERLQINIDSIQRQRELLKETIDGFSKMVKKELLDDTKKSILSDDLSRDAPLPPLPSVLQSCFDRQFLRITDDMDAIYHSERLKANDLIDKLNTEHPVYKKQTLVAANHEEVRSLDRPRSRQIKRTHHDESEELSKDNEKKESSQGEKCHIRQKRRRRKAKSS